jgi:hypothetical protein
MRAVFQFQWCWSVYSRRGLAEANERTMDLAKQDPHEQNIFLVVNQTTKEFAHFMTPIQKHGSKT